MRMACAIFFLAFTFFYVYCYQADIIAVTQHVLSGGATHYNKTIGAVLITLVLWLIQMGLYALSGLDRRAHALTYFPSFLLLAILTDVTPNLDHESYLGCWVWLFPLLMLGYAGLVAVCRQLQPLEIPINMEGLFSRIVWENLLTMVVMALMTTAIGCNDETFHHRMRIEDDLLSCQYDDALAAGIHEEETDSSLTMLRVLALSKKHELGEKLFTYPLTGGSAAMMPNGTSVKMMMVLADTTYRWLGVRFRQSMPARLYIEKLHQKHRATREAHEWLICAYLLDCDLDNFARSLQKYYGVGDSINNHQAEGRALEQRLPLHYREALVLYNHTSRQPRIIYHNAVMDADFEDYNALMNKTPDSRARYTALRDTYGKTYWFYYQYNKHKKSSPK